ncbi:MAG TPA: tetratricopeptide repeat protein [Terracidiphilus sp.]|nr:tetratricopeptide repeat protein [Terracidiphilus sp.]
MSALCLGETPEEAKTRKEIVQINKRAVQGNVQQQIELAAAYMNGRGVARDLTQAAHWYQKAAEAGDPGAENQIGYFCQHGIGVRVDFDRAIHWYQLASASGSLPAKVNLGVSYLNGMGVPRNPETARQLLLEATQKGEGLGAAYLGDMYLLGIGVPRDPAQAEKWFAAGARLHDTVATFSYGYLLSMEPNHEHDFRRAADLLRFSASKGWSEPLK